MQPRLSKVPAKGLGVQSSHRGSSQEENPVSELQAKDRHPLDIKRGRLKVQTEWAETASSRLESRTWPAGQGMTNRFPWGLRAQGTGVMLLPCLGHLGVPQGTDCYLQLAPGGAVSSQAGESCGVPLGSCALAEN